MSLLSQKLPYLHFIFFPLTPTTGHKINHQFFKLNLSFFKQSIIPEQIRFKKSANFIAAGSEVSVPLSDYQLHYSMLYDTHRLLTEGIRFPKCLHCINISCLFLSYYLNFTKMTTANNFLHFKIQNIYP